MVYMLIAMRLALGACGQNANMNAKIATFCYQKTF
jgi:hypothetical protein